MLLLVAQVLENMRGKVDVSRVDGSDSSMENTLLERIRSIKHEKSVTTLSIQTIICYHRSISTFTDVSYFLLLYFYICVSAVYCGVFITYYIVHNAFLLLH